MPEVSTESHFGLDQQGLTKLAKQYWNLTEPALCEIAVQKGEGVISAGGALAVVTGEHTGRSPNDKFIAHEIGSTDDVFWGDVNRPITPEKFDRLHEKVLAYFEGRDAYVQDCYVGADPKHRLAIRVVTEDAWHSLFVRNLFIPVTDPTEQRDHKPDFTVLNVPSLVAEPEVDGTNSGTFILVHYGKKIVLVGGTSYAGEIKKSIFSVMNYLLPKKGVLPMHCSANVGANGDSALFFGLSGTGKTTLSADPDRRLIGDDEHGWTDDGIFNFEGGCYAKAIKLDPATEPQIYAATQRFGTVLENVVIDPVSRKIDFYDGSLTENTRAAYPVDFIPGAVEDGMGGHPKNIFMLTCDAFGVLPPISHLAPEQAMYHFLAGYTAKVAGTEKGLGKEPQATFSACFGAPFLPLSPAVYAELLGEKMRRYGASCWLVNTGWTGGPYGIGERMSLPQTRALISAALAGNLKNGGWRTEGAFGLDIPTRCEGVPEEVLNPRDSWSDPDAYDAKAKVLAALFRENFESLGAKVAPHIAEAGPRL